MFVWDDVVPSGLLNAASWRLAAELVSAIPGARVRELHPGGDQYDVLAVLTDDGRVHLDINRNGGLHVHAAPTSCVRCPASGCGRPPASPAELSV